MIAEIPHPTLGTLRLAGIPLKYSATPGAIRRPPPLLGEHTDDVLADVLGYAPERIEALRRQGVV
jgi:crotonobetainyl-CoA:carnitine CoA-transferase CaiB-like acyl-CoA transferase